MSYVPLTPLEFEAAVAAQRAILRANEEAYARSNVRMVEDGKEWAARLRGNYAPIEVVRTP